MASYIRALIRVLWLVECTRERKGSTALGGKIRRFAEEPAEDRIRENDVVIYYFVS